VASLNLEGKKRFEKYIFSNLEENLTILNKPV
jgi:hypothetical protein